MDLYHQIMLIEDDADDRELFCEAVNTVAPGVDTTMAVHGQDALDRLSRTQPLPQIIFTDIVMPIMDGFDFLRRIKSPDYPSLNTLPVIVMTTSVDNCALCYELGAALYFNKPASYLILQNILQEIFSRKQAAWPALRPVLENKPIWPVN